ncbi:DUF4157 domain-containing protein [Streptomyces glaucescens]|uniref:eCIS core domain-containing protein n=1 Tax=Streptomyces glaucescens TaxID=1907 RepID=UPI00344D1233
MSNARTQDAHAERSAEARRRKRRERAASSRAPEPKNVVSGAGQPLDPGVRRELEERLGHDLGRVRLHTGRDAGRLTELLGADAVAVGQDVLFREGMFMPGTDEGRRLLAHELLHTVQNPHGLGALRAGRGLGAVSLPQQPIEREAEGAAQEPPHRPGQDAAPVEQGQATPGWLRYATVNADRSRAEQMDPATLVDRLANAVVRSLRGDPQDLSLRTRKQLSRLPREMRDAVLDRLERRLLSSEHERVLDLVDQIEAYDDYAGDELERHAHDAPQMEPDTAEEVRAERDEEQRRAEERKAERRQPRQAPGPEKEGSGEEGAAGSTPRNGGTPEQGTTPEGGRAPREPQRGARPPGPAGGRTGQAAPGAPATRRDQTPSGASSGGTPEGGRQGGEQQSASSAAGKERKQAQGGEEATERRETPAASKEESAVRNRPGAAEAAVTGRQVKPQDRRGQQKPTAGTPVRSGQDTPLPGRRSTLEGKRSQDLEGLQEEKDADPVTSGSESEVEAGGAGPSAWDIRLRPEDFLPQQDLDVSGVPAADELDSSSSAPPPMPTFPAPPPTRADEVQALRDAEDAEDAAAEAEPEEATADEPLDLTPSTETEGGPDSATGFGGAALQPAAATAPVPGTASGDPKSGDDPKAGPVAAQTTVQEAPGKAGGTSEGGSDVREPAAKEAAGTPAGGDRAPAAPERESQQAAGGSSAKSGTGTKEPRGGGTDAETPTVPAPAGSAPAQGTAGDTGGASRSPGTAPGPAPDGSAGPSDRTDTPAVEPGPGPARTEPAPAPAPSPAPEPKRAPGTASGRRTTTRSAGRSPGGGGGGSAAAPARGRGRKDSGPAPDLAGVSPEAGLATASALKPHMALDAMGGVGGAVDRSVGDEHRTLAAAPPQIQRPAGAPQTLQGKPRTDAPAQYSQDPAQQAAEPEREDAEVTGAKEPEGRIEAEKAEEPGGWDTFKMALGFGLGWVADKLGFEVDAQELAAKFAGLPTKDEALRQAQAGNAPGVQMQGAAGQAATEQDGHVDAKGQETLGTARDDAGRGMGEDQVYPDAPREQLTAKVPGRQGGGPGAGAGGGATGAVPPEAASEVAEHERGPQFRAAFSEGRRGMSESRQAKDRDFRDSQAKHRQQVDAEIATNTETQAGEREKAMTEVTAQREDWRAAQDKELKSLGDKKTDRREKVRQDVEDQEKKTDDNVGKEKEGSDKKIRDEADRAEREADRTKNTAAEDSGNWITKAFDWIKQKVIEIKNAIVRVIRAARDAVTGFIRNFKETVERWINEARKNIVEAIKNFIKDLIEFAKAMVRAVIDLAKRIRDLITTLVQAAIALVNRLSQMLKQMITDLLNALGKLLSSILDILKKALLDVVKAVVDTVKGILRFAAGLLSALGDFMLIAVDFLSDPGGWLSGAKNSAVDGAKNHLFREVKSAVRAWFQAKIEEILGIPKAVFDKLLKGGITLEQIVKETWDAIVPQLPLIIGEIVITKVVAKLIPGAGWVMAVIDAIRTAIGALGEILRAMGAVLDWLKAVRTGGAGILFAKAVAAGIVALLELAYEALLSGIGKYVAKVGRRFKDIAARLGKGGQGDGRQPAAGGSDGTGERRTGPRRQPVPRRAPAGGSPPRRPARPAVVPEPPTPAPGKPRIAAPGTGRPRPSGPAAGRPTAGPGRTDTRERPGSRPGPPATERTRPDRTTPSRPRDEDRAAPSRPADTDAPGRPAGRQAPQPAKRDDTAPGRDGTRVPGSPRREGTPRPGRDGRADRDGRKPEDGDKGPEKRKKDDGGKDKKRPRRDDRQDPRRSRRPPREDRRRDEDSPDSKSDRLRRIVDRIRPVEERMLRNGVTRDHHNVALEAMRRWYRLTGLVRSHPPHFEILATLNPTRNVINGWQGPEAGYDADGFDKGDKTTPVDWLTRTHRDPKLPPVKSPRFEDDKLASSFTSEYINRKFAHAERDRKTRRSPEPLGFRYLNTLTNLTDSERWDRTHLLPYELGGNVKNQNLVPARHYQNMKLRVTEGPAGRWVDKGGQRIVWYQVDIAYHPRQVLASGDVVEGFPSHLNTAWGKYKKKPDVSGASQTHWDAQPAVTQVSISGMETPPTSSTGPVCRVNDEQDTYRLKLALGANDRHMRAILLLRSQKRFDNEVEMIDRIKAYQPRFKLEKIERHLARLRGQRRLRFKR